MMMMTTSVQRHQQNRVDDDDVDTTPFIISNNDDENNNNNDHHNEHDKKYSSSFCQNRRPCICINNFRRILEFLLIIGSLGMVVMYALKTSSSDKSSSSTTTMTTTKVYNNNGWTFFLPDNIRNSDSDNSQIQLLQRELKRNKNNNMNFKPSKHQHHNSFAETVIQKEQHPVATKIGGGSFTSNGAVVKTKKRTNQNNGGGGGGGYYSSDDKNNIVSMKNNNNNNNNNGGNGNVNGNGNNNNDGGNNNQKDGVNNNKKQQQQQKKKKTADDFGSSATKTFDIFPPPKPLYDNITPGRKLYRPRGKPMTEEQRTNMINKWGSWTLFDDTINNQRSTLSEDIYKQYPNRDIPRSEFPPSAWQTNTDYLSKFLPESLALVERAQNAILAEYGLKRDNVQDTILAEIITEDTFKKASDVKAGKRGKRESSNKGGWTTTNSWDGLKRRLLHAIMTEDNFIFAMGGHSSAAGHGNHFTQSYTLQVQWILEAVFARLGIQHESRNFGNGGLGTLHNGLSAASIYGPDVDMLMWDSGMTAGQDDAAVAARQQIMVGSKVPVIWTLANVMAVELHLEADVDIGYVGNGDDFIPKAHTIEKIERLPWAVQYVRCANEIHDVCRSNEYVGKCWMDRDDGFTPTNKQKKEPGGRAKWHPGNRKHQVTGRIIAYNILEALKQALEEWNNADNYVLDDDVWHMTERYTNVRNKLVNNKQFKGQCKWDKFQMQYICYTPFQGRTEFTPRAYPYDSTIRQLMPREMLEHINTPKESVYWPPDVYNPSLHPPDGAIDVLNIVEAGVDFKDVLAPDYTTSFYKKPTFANPPKVPIGKGVQLDTATGDMYCDGSVDSWCKRGGSADCLLYGHNDGRNGLLFNSYSGWIVMNIPDVKNGIINVKVETWHKEKDMWKTNNWKTINGEAEDETDSQRHHRERYLSSSMLRQKDRHSWNNDTAAAVESNLYHDNSGGIGGGFNNNNSSVLTLEQQQLRRLEQCDGKFYFEYAIDGVISRYDGKETEEKIQPVQRVVQVMPILNDPESYADGQEKEVEIAIRIVGACHNTVWKLTHVYWS